MDGNVTMTSEQFDKLIDTLRPKRLEGPIFNDKDIDSAKTDYLCRLLQAASQVWPVEHLGGLRDEVISFLKSKM